MLVKNINGTSSTICKCGSWLEHWKRFSDQELPAFCPVAECLEKDVVGAHVQKDNDSDSSWYILPLCKTHNSRRGETLSVSDTYKLVPANISLTCGKL